MQESGVLGPALLTLGLLLACVRLPAIQVAGAQGPQTAVAMLPVQRLPGDRTLTPADQGELARLIAPHGSPWLILEPYEGQLAGNWYSWVYLQPTEGRGSVRRGRFLLLSAKALKGETNLRNWNATAHNYSQVPIGPTEVLTRDSQDFPFLDEQRLSEADLLSLAAFVRKCPCQPESGASPISLLNTVDGTRPIGSISVSVGGDVEVSVSRDRWSHWTLTMRRTSGAWRLLTIRFSIA